MDFWIGATIYCYMIACAGFSLVIFSYNGYKIEDFSTVGKLVLFTLGVGVLVWLAFFPLVCWLCSPLRWFDRVQWCINKLIRPERKKNE